MHCWRKNQFCGERVFHHWKRASCQQLPIHHGESYHVHVINTANESASNQSVISPQNTQNSLRIPLHRKITELCSPVICVMKCINLCKYKKSLYMHGALAVPISHPVLSDFICCARWYMHIPIWWICLYKMMKPVYFPHNILIDTTNIPLWNRPYQLPQFRMKD